MDKKITVVILSAAIVGTLSFLLSPYWSAAGLASAAVTGNADAVSDYVDFPRLRDDMKGQAIVAIGSEVKKSKHKTRVVLAAAFGTLMLDNVVDTLVTPQMISMAISRAVSGQGASQLDLMFALIASNRTEWIDSSTFRLHINNESSMTWRREGFSWRLTRLTFDSLS